MQVKTSLCTCICISWWLKTTCPRKHFKKSLKDETRSYCLSCSSNAAEDCLYCKCAVLYTVNLLKFFGGTSKKCDNIIPVLIRAGDEDSSVAWVMPNSLKQWNVSVVCLITEESKGFQWKIISLMRVCLGPNGPEEIKYKKQN